MVLKSLGKKLKSTFRGKKKDKSEDAPAPKKGTKGPGGKKGGGPGDNTLPLHGWKGGDKGGEPGDKKIGGHRDKSSKKTSESKPKLGEHRKNKGAPPQKWKKGDKGAPGGKGPVIGNNRGKGPGWKPGQKGGPGGKGPLTIGNRNAPKGGEGTTDAPETQSPQTQGDNPYVTQGGGNPYLLQGGDNPYTPYAPQGGGNPYQSIILLNPYQNANAKDDSDESDPASEEQGGTGGSVSNYIRTGDQGSVARGGIIYDYDSDSDSDSTQDSDDAGPQFNMIVASEGTSAFQHSSPGDEPKGEDKKDEVAKVESKESDESDSDDSGDGGGGMLTVGAYQNLAFGVPMMMPGGEGPQGGGYVPKEGGGETPEGGGTPYLNDQNQGEGQSPYLIQSGGKSPYLNYQNQGGGKSPYLNYQNQGDGETPDPNQGEGETPTPNQDLPLNYLNLNTGMAGSNYRRLGGGGGLDGFQPLSLSSNYDVSSSSSSELPEEKPKEMREIKRQEAPDVQGVAPESDSEGVAKMQEKLRGNTRYNKDVDEKTLSGGSTKVTRGALSDNEKDSKGWGLLPMRDIYRNRRDTLGQIKKGHDRDLLGNGSPTQYFLSKGMQLDYEARKVLATNLKAGRGTKREDTVIRFNGKQWVHADNETVVDTTEVKALDYSINELRSKLQGKVQDLRFSGLDKKLAKLQEQLQGLNGSYEQQQETARKVGIAGRYIFVMNAKGEFFAGKSITGVVHHSSFLAGGAVACAGEVAISGGVMTAISNTSGHYRPGPVYLWQAVKQLQMLGVPLSSLRVDVMGVSKNFKNAEEFLGAMDPVANPELFDAAEAIKHLDAYFAEKSRNKHKEEETKKEGEDKKSSTESPPVGGGQ